MAAITLEQNGALGSDTTLRQAFPARSHPILTHLTGWCAHQRSTALVPAMLLLLLQRLRPLGAKGPGASQRVRRVADRLIEGGVHRDRSRHGNRLGGGGLERGRIGCGGQFNGRFARQLLVDGVVVQQRAGDIKAGVHLVVDDRERERESGEFRFGGSQR